MIESILIVKTSAIGDVITSLDALAYLREQCPKAQIDWVVERSGASLLQAHPDIDCVLVCDTKKWRKAPFKEENRREMKQFHQELKKRAYDVIFDLQGNSKSAVFTAIARGKEKVGFSFKPVSEKPNVLVTNRRFSIPKDGPVRKRYLDLIRSYFNDDTPYVPSQVAFSLTREEEERLSHSLTADSTKPKIMISLGSNWKNKRLAFDVVTECMQLIEKAISPYFFIPYGNALEKQDAERLVELFPQSCISVGEMSLPLWQALMAHMECVVTMDSAALHLCGTTATPSFSLFGSSLASVYKPLGKAHVALQGTCPYNEKFTMRCPKLRTCPTRACMQTYGVQEIVSSFLSFWQALPK